MTFVPNRVKGNDDANDDGGTMASSLIMGVHPGCLIVCSMEVMIR